MLQLFFILIVLCLFIICESININTNTNTNTGTTRGAIIITLAGSKKLSSYFEWSCRTFGNSLELYDMLVFHESNEKLLELKCASNVKFIDLGENGLSKLISYKVMNTTIANIAKYTDLYQVVSEVLHHIPRLLVNIKPMSGYLFSEWLQNGVNSENEHGNESENAITTLVTNPNTANTANTAIPYYSHWTYSDPDIIWGNLHDWIDRQDLTDFDIISLAKTLDAGRLFVRGQFALHKNIPRVNNIYQTLSYLNQQSFAKSIGQAVGLIRQKKSSDEIYSRCFHSAEGWYSSAVMKSGVSFKVIGRGFDDFQKNPVIMVRKQLVRCPLGKGVTMVACIQKLLGIEDPSAASNKSNNTILDSSRWLHGLDLSISDFTAVAATPVEPVSLKNKCYMNWLPVPLRYW